MNFKTLNYIHALLVEDVARHRKAYELACDAQYRAEEKEAENLKSLQSVRENAFQSLSEARDALEVFESKEWA